MAFSSPCGGCSCLPPPHPCPFLQPPPLTPALLPPPRPPHPPCVLSQRLLQKRLVLLQKAAQAPFSWAAWNPVSFRCAPRASWLGLPQPLQGVYEGVHPARQGQCMGWGALISVAPSWPCPHPGGPTDTSRGLTRNPRDPAAPPTRTHTTHMYTQDTLRHPLTEPQITLLGQWAEAPGPLGSHGPAWAGVTATHNPQGRRSRRPGGPRASCQGTSSEPQPPPCSAPLPEMAALEPSKPEWSNRGSVAHQQPLQPPCWDIPNAECAQDRSLRAGGTAQGGWAVACPRPGDSDPLLWPTSSTARCGRRGPLPTGAVAHPTLQPWCRRNRSGVASGR